MRRWIAFLIPYLKFLIPYFLKQRLNSIRILRLMFQ